MENTKQLWLLTVLAVLAVFVGGYFVLISPQSKKPSQIRGDVATAESTNRALEAQIAMLKQQAKQLPREQARLAELGKKIPNNPALPSLLRSLSDAADANKANLISLNPSKPTIAASSTSGGLTAPPVGTTGTTTATTTASAPLPTLGIMPVELKLTGHFAQLREFLAAIEDLQRALLVHSIEVKPDCLPPDGDPPPDDCDPALLQMNIGFRTYMTVTQAAPVAPKVVAPAAATTEGK